MQTALARQSVCRHVAQWGMDAARPHCVRACRNTCVCLLRQVAANKASTIIVLDPESTSSANAEAIKVSVAMSLTALGGSAGTQRVVVQGGRTAPSPSPTAHVLLALAGCVCWTL